MVAYTDIETLLVLSPYEMPSDQRIAAIADAHFNTALANLKILLDVDFKAYIERKAGKFFQAYGFVEEDEEAASKRTKKRAKRTKMLLPQQPQL